MEVLDLNGEVYVKANSIAKELGYTSDYVGQLCRSGKIKSQLIGRSWYVSEESIRSHKTTRYRSTKIKSTQALKKTIDSTTKEKKLDVLNSLTENKNRKNFYDKAGPQKFSYTEDQTELIPTLTKKLTGKSINIEVRHADAKSIEIKQQMPSYKLTATEKPIVRFTGAVKVTDVKSPDILEDSEIPDDKKTINQTKKETETQTQTQTQTIIKEKKLPLRRSGVIAMTRQVKEAEANTDTVRVANNVIVNQDGSGALKIVLVFACTMAVIFSIIMPFSQQNLFVEETSEGSYFISSTNYSFEIEQIIEVIEGLKHSFLE
jgi:hypothetical protein